jgi:hypothetical protein
MWKAISLGIFNTLFDIPRLPKHDYCTIILQMRTTLWYLRMNQWILGAVYSGFFRRLIAQGNIWTTVQ